MAALPFSAPNAKALWDALVQQASSLKSIAQQIQAGGQPVMALSALINCAANLVASATSVVNSATLQPALLLYTQQITGQTSYNFLPDFQASIVAAQGIVTAAIAEYPKDSSGNMIDRTISASGVISNTILAQSQIPQTLAAISAWLATVD